VRCGGRGMFFVWKWNTNLWRDWSLGEVLQRSRGDALRAWWRGPAACDEDMTHAERWRQRGEVCHENGSMQVSTWIAQEGCSQVTTGL